MTSEELHSKLPHPIIDSDAHWLDFGPVLQERVTKIAGADVAALFTGFGELLGEPILMTPEERRNRRVAHPGFWQVPMDARDRATAMMPKLLYERLDEIGLDFCVMYPTTGIDRDHSEDDKLRLRAVRAFNIFSAEWFADYADRLTPVAIIPTKTPDEAIEELEYATQQLGMKAALFHGMIPRQVPAAKDDPDAGKLGMWYDVLGLDSEYNYDPVWEKCVELGIPPTFHASGRGYALRRSPSNFVYNHIGHFASTAEAICKALFLGGVTRRFPKLNVAFLEGGTAWACQLYADLVEHWEVRNPEGLKNVNPDNLDHGLLIELAQEYAPPDMAALLTNREAALWAAMNPEISRATGGEDNLNDFAACEINKKEDLRELFGRFYFGCEAEDRMNATAFNTKANPMNARLNALFSSDIGHFDVAHMDEVLQESYELVEEGVMTEEDFRDFTFTNPVHFWADNNPDFFKGTVVEKQAAEVLGQS